MLSTAEGCRCSESRPVFCGILESSQSRYVRLDALSVCGGGGGTWRFEEPSTVSP